MFTKAEIQSIDYTSNTCLVRIPLFENAASDFPVVVEAQIACEPGIHSGYMKGDKVWVNFETDLPDKPVVVGKMYLGVKNEQKATGGSVQASTLTVENVATLPAETTFTGIEKYNSIKKIQDKLLNLDAGRGDGSQNRTFLTELTFSSESQEHKIHIAGERDKFNGGASLGTTIASWDGDKGTFVITSTRLPLANELYYTAGVKLRKADLENKQTLTMAYTIVGVKELCSIGLCVVTNNNTKIQYVYKTTVGSNADVLTLDLTNILPKIKDADYENLYLAISLYPKKNSCSCAISGIYTSEISTGSSYSMYLNTNNYYGIGANNTVANLLQNIEVAGNRLPVKVFIEKDNTKAFYIALLSYYDTTKLVYLEKLGSEFEDPCILSLEDDNYVVSCKSRDITRV